MIELLPLPVWPTSATVWPGLGGEVDVVQHQPRRVVAERDAAELDPHARRRAARPRESALGSGRATAPGASSQSGRVSISRKIRSAPAIAMQRLVVLVADHRDRREEQVGQEEELMRSPISISCRETRASRPASAARDEELAVQLEQRREDRRGARERDVVASGRPAGERKRPAFVSCRTKPWVTRMPLTDSASVAVTRLKLSWEARLSRLSFIRKWRFTVQRTGAIAHDDEEQLPVAVQPSPRPRRPSGRTGSR
jgi:hypothetical protein